jgi:hypothetical protein
VGIEEISSVVEQQ